MIQRNDHLFNPLRKLAVDTIESFQKPLVEAGRLALAHQRAYERTLAQQAAGLVKEIAASAPRMPGIQISRNTKAELEALEAYWGGDVDVFWSYVEERIGRKPAARIRVMLRYHIDQYDDNLPLGYVPRFLRVHQAKLEEQSIANGLDRKTAEIRRGINTSRYLSIPTAFEALRTRGQTREQVFSEGAPGITYVEEPEPASSSSLPGRVANEFRRQGI